MSAMTRLPLRLLHSRLSSSCLLDISPQLWVVRFQLFHASILGAYSISSICFSVSQLSYYFSYYTMTVDGICEAYFRLGCRGLSLISASGNPTAYGCYGNPFRTV